MSSQQTPVNETVTRGSLTAEKMTEKKLRDLFNKYDKNRDQKLDENELKSLVRDIFIETHKLVLESDLMEQDLVLINEKARANNLGFFFYLPY